MQISTIDIRIEGVEHGPSGKKDGKSAGMESAFAAFFANAQHDVQRKPVAKAGSAGVADESEPIDGVEQAAAKTKAAPAKKQGAVGEQDAESSAATRVPAASKRGEETPGTVAETGGDSAVEIVIVADSAKRSRATYTVSSASTMTSVAPAGDTGPTAANAAVRVPANESVPTAPGTPETVTSVASQIPAPASSALATSVVPQIPAPDLAAPPVASTASATAVPVIETESLVAPVQVKPVPDGKAPNAVVNEFVSTEVESESEPIAELNGTGTDAKSDSEETPPASSGTERQPKIAASKATSHSVTRRTDGAAVETPPIAKVQEEAPPANVPSNATNADVNATQPGEVTKPAAGTTFTAPETVPKPEQQVVRNVTQLVAPDGSIVATQTTETRTEGAQASVQRDVVVVEKVTVQALPEQALRGVRYLTANGEHTMRIRLVPESLGEVRLEIVASKGEVSVKLASASAAVREILQTHAHGLQTAIAQDNAGVVRVTVTPDVSSNAWLSGNTPRHSGQHDGSAHQRSGPSSSYREPNQNPSSASRRETAHAGNLNVYV